jgi:hypothetical protein
MFPGFPQKAMSHADIICCAFTEIWYTSEYLKFFLECRLGRSWNLGGTGPTTTRGRRACCKCGVDLKKKNTRDRLYCPGAHDRPSQVLPGLSARTVEHQGSTVNLVFFFSGPPRELAACVPARCYWELELHWNRCTIPSSCVPVCPGTVRYARDICTILLYCCLPSVRCTDHLLILRLYLPKGYGRGY